MKIAVARSTTPTAIADHKGIKAESIAGNANIAVVRYKITVVRS
jgi:hypothetical protein